jgi:hypothetical protein
MLRFGTDCYPPNRWGNDKEEEEFRLLLRESMHDLNRRAFSADCKARYKTPDQTQEDYFSFDPDDRQSVYRNAPAVCKCLSDMRTKAWRARRALPPIEALPQAIRGCPQQLIVEYLEAWARGRPP